MRAEKYSVAERGRIGIYGPAYFIKKLLCEYLCPLSGTGAVILTSLAVKEYIKPTFGLI